MKCRLNVDELHGVSMSERHNWNYDWSIHKGIDYKCKLNRKNPFTQLDVWINKTWRTFWLRYILLYSDGKWVANTECASPDSI